MGWLDLKTFALLITCLYMLGAGVGLLVGAWNQRRGARLALAFALAASLLVAGWAAWFWLSGQSMAHGLTILPLVPKVQSKIPSTSFPGLHLELFVDRLSAFFLLLTGSLATGVALYSFAWLADRRKPHRIAAFFNLFVLSACLLLVVNDAYFFLIFLECITLAFGYLTLYKHSVLLEQIPPPDVRPPALAAEMEDAKRAFKVYLISSHAGVILVTVALSLLALHASNTSFDSMRESALGGSAVTAGAVFLLALLGFGIKTALAPFQAWMGLTHPYLPTNVHALVSSVIIKVAGIYGMIRVFFEFLSAPAWWWGWLLLLLAGVTALVGVFYALTSRDLKTALANHSVENVGIILAGIGLALLLAVDADLAPLAALALIAGLYHLLNHAVFKGLLFLGTGAIENRTGTVELERLGGLIHRFPWTSITFLVGAIAIAGFPPFNGFISEWLTLQALFAGQQVLGAAPKPWMMVGLFGALLMLATAFGLTAMAFVKIAGEALLGAPRHPQVLEQERAGDVPWPMRGVLVALAILCLLLGVLPGLVADELAQIPQEILDGAPSVVLGGMATSLTLHAEVAGSGMEAANAGTVATGTESEAATGGTEGADTDIESAGYRARLSMLPFLGLFGLPLLLAAWVSARRRSRSRGPVWTCGTPYRSEAMQIPGGAFAFLVWEWAGGQRRDGAAAPDEPVPWRLAVSDRRFVLEFFRRLISAFVRRLSFISDRFGDRFQNGDIRQYLAYLFVVFILLLLVSVLWGGLGS